MSLLFRAIWADDRPSLCESALAAFNGWTRVKTNNSLGVAVGGRSHGSVTRSIRELDGSFGDQRVELEGTVERASGAGDVTEALRGTLVETREDGTRWDTTLRAWQEQPDASGSPVGWLWVDVEAVGPGGLDRLAVAAPRLVTELIASGKNPRRGPIPLSAKPRRYSGHEGGELLAAELSNFDRDLPVVVFSDDVIAAERFGSTTHSFGDITARAAAQTAGIAAVAVIDGAAVGGLREALGIGHSVWGGALRMYLPDLDPATNHDQWRHRYVTAERYMRFRDTAATTISRSLAPASTTKRPPVSYSAAKDLLDERRNAGSDANALLEVAFEEIVRLEQANIALTVEKAAQEENLFATVIDWEDALDQARGETERTAELHRHVKQLTSQLAQAGLTDRFWEEPQETPPPERASNLQDAATLAQQWLSDRLVIPATALRDLQELDTTVTAAAWGQTAWRALRALHAYATELAEGQSVGSFWTWCEKSMHPLAWPATDKKLSMTESETVQDSPTLSRYRVLPVDIEVDPSGEIYMAAHIKIATGGGNLAPRIYFHVDAAHCKVHVGFFGPHKYMPNTRT